MRALLLTLFLGMVSGRLGEWDCGGCTTLVDSECVSFDIGEDCIPDNYDDLVRDLKLYRTFYYLEDTLILSVRCLDYGISIKHTSGLPLNTTIPRRTFDVLYKGYFTRDCPNWSFSPYTRQNKHIYSTSRF